MRKIFTFLVLLFCMTCSLRAEVVKIQGIPVSGALATSVSAHQRIAAAEADAFSFDDIQFWVGEGENKAALVLQWNAEGETNALVWGYRWDGNATGYDMLTAIAKADSHLYALIDNTSYGYTVAGLGYDVNGDGNQVLIYNGEEVPVVDGLVDAQGRDYDDWTSKDETDYWWAGWYNGYWSYYVDDAGALPPTGYSGLGASSRNLVNGCVDGWNYAAGMQTFDWKPLQAAVSAPIVPALPETFTDGFFIQNEDWLGHANGSINWIGSDDTVYYNIDEKANDGKELMGVTSESATLYGDYYLAMSKQGNRLVVFDAKTMKVIKTLEQIGGDGRDLVVVDDNKAYLGTSNGVFVLNMTDFTVSEANIGGEDYSGQIGQMAKVGKYAFAVKSSVGVYVIDIATDEIVKTIEEPSIYGLTVSNDGTVWATTGSGEAKTNVLAINPVTLEATVQQLPYPITSPWFAWMVDKMCPSYAENAMFYAYDGSWNNTEKKLCKLLIDENGQLVEDKKFNFTMPVDNNGEAAQISYGTIRINPATDELILTTTQDGYGANYSNNWVHFVDTKTGEIKRTIVMKNDDGENYYWFPAIPVMPDNETPVLTTLSVALEGQEVVVPFSELFTDVDNQEARAAVEVSVTDESVAKAVVEGAYVRFIPVAEGTTDANVSINSNGQKIEGTVAVSVSGVSLVSGLAEDNVKYYPTAVSDMLHVAGTGAGVLTVYDLAGVAVKTCSLQGNDAVDLSGLTKGHYIIKIEFGENMRIGKIVKL